MQLHHSLAAGQPDTRSSALFVEPAEHVEDLRVKARIDTRPVVSDREQPLVIIYDRGHVNDGLALAVLDCVADQVLKHDANQGRVAPHRR